MTRKEIQKILDDNRGKELYLLHSEIVLHGGAIATIHERISKTNALRCARSIHSVRFKTYGEERPDLERYCSTSLGWNDPIVTFDATNERNVD